MQVFCQFSVQGDLSERAKVKAFADALSAALVGVDTPKSGVETKQWVKQVLKEKAKTPEPEEDEDEEDGEDDEEEDAKPVKRSKKAAPAKKAAKAKKKPVDEDEDADEDDSDDETEEDSDADDGDNDSDDNSEDSDDDADDEEASPAKSSKKGAAAKSKLSLDGDIVPACASTAERAGRVAVMKLLKEFGVTNVRDLDQSDYTKLNAALKKLPTQKSKKV